MTFVSNRSANMSSGLLLVSPLNAQELISKIYNKMPQDPLPSPTSESSSSGPRYRPYASPNHHVTKGRYITSNDPRGYM